MHAFLFKFFFFFWMFGMLLMLFSYTFFIESFIIPYCNFQNISTRSKCGTDSEAQIYPTLKNIHALRRPIESIQSNPWLCGPINQLPRFLGHFDGRQPTFVLPWPLVARISANRLTNSEVRHRGLWRFRQGSLKPVLSGSADTIFQGWAMHIPIKGPDLKAPIVEAPTPIKLSAGMVQRCRMALDR